MSENILQDQGHLRTPITEDTSNDDTVDSTALPTQAIPERERAPYSHLGPRVSRTKSETKEERKAKADIEASLFSCRICLDTASEPVVTNCGHLYCYECLISWFEAQPSLESCPVCKSHCTREKLTPIYGCGREEMDPRIKERNRPRPKTTPAPSSTRSSSGNPFTWFDDWTAGSRTNQGGVTFHAGFLPFLGLGVGFQIPFGGVPDTTAARNNNNNRNTSSDDEDNAQLNRFFIMRIVALLTVVFILPRIFDYLSGSQ